MQSMRILMINSKDWLVPTITYTLIFKADSYHFAYNSTYSLPLLSSLLALVFSRWLFVWATGYWGMARCRQVDKPDDQCGATISHSPTQHCAQNSCSEESARVEAAAIERVGIPYKHSQHSYRENWTIRCQPLYCCFLFVSRKLNKCDAYPRYQVIAHFHRCNVFIYIFWNR